MKRVALLARAAPAACAGVLAVGFTRLFLESLVARVDDADVWWVAAAGRQMLATGAVPRQNGFSFVEPDHAWVMHEWLFGPLYGWGLGALGPSFFALVAASALAGSGVLVVAATVGRTRHVALGCVMALVGLVLFAHPTARPTWVALVFPAAMAKLAFRPSLGRAAACACVLIELLWANAHGSFPLGVVLLAAAAVDGLGDRRRRIAVVVAAAAVTMVNPYGLRLHALVLDYLLSPWGHGIGDLTPILEYAPLWDRRYFAVNSALATLALATLGLLAVSSLRRPVHRARAALVVLLLPLAIVHARYAPTVAVVAAIVLVPVLDDAVDRTPLGAYAGGPLRFRRVSALLSAAALLGMGAIAFATVAARPAADWIDPSLASPSLLRLVADLPDGARVVTPFRSAGLVLWMASLRGVRVFYDSRNDCYSGETRREALRLLEEPPAVIREELERWDTHYALVPSPRGEQSFPRRGIDGALAAASTWSVRARDGDWCLYARRIGP